jgi:hypothetical protein
LQLPSAGIKSIIAHELAHSIDPCLASMELVTVHPSAKEEVMQKEFARQMQEFEKQQEQNGVYSYKPVLKQPESKVKYAADFLGLVSQNSMTDQVSPAISLKTNPFTSTIECLKSRESIAARATSDAEVQKIMTDAIDNLKKTGATEENSEQLKSYNKALSSLSERMGKNGACSFMPGQSGQSQVQEAFADWVATEVLGKDVERADAAKKKDMAFESMAFFLALECPAKTNASTKAKELLTAMKCGGESSISDLNSIYDAMGRNSDSHPFGQARVNRLFLAQPQIAKALGCEGKKTGGEAEVKHCE